MLLCITARRDCAVVRTAKAFAQIQSPVSTFPRVAMPPMDAAAALRSSLEPTGAASIINATTCRSIVLTITTVQLENASATRALAGALLKRPVFGFRLAARPTTTAEIV